MVGSCEQGSVLKHDETLCGEFLYQLSNCWHLRNDFSSWNQHATLKTVGMLGCDKEEVLELTCAKSNAEN